MPFDNPGKLLFEKHPATFAGLVLKTPQTSVKVLKTELSIEPIRADYVIFLQLQGRLLHLEFQTKLESTPPLPLRMQGLLGELYRLYHIPVTQVVVLATTQPQALLQQVVERVNQLQPEQRPEISAYTQILAGLKYKKDLIQQLFREGVMRESVIYQEILAEGEQRGEQRERSLILHQLIRRVGEVPRQLLERIQTLSIEQLENLAEALLDFQAIGDLEAWFTALD